MRFALFGILTAVLLAGSAGGAFAHCQVPCGIYDDQMRFDMIHESLTTIEKAMSEIRDLSAHGETNYNQLVRWINTKEAHAQKIQDIVNAYFLTQRIKPVAKGADGRESYLESLELLHGMLVEAMKTKQTLDPAHVTRLHELTETFHELYFKGK